MEQVTIISNANSRVGVSLPNIRFSREWPSKGSKVKVDTETFEEMMYDNGVKYMFESGILYIEDMDLKKKVGLEPEDATEPVNVIILSDKEKEKLLTTAPNWQFKEKVSKLTYEEIHNLADYAIDHEILPSLEKCDIIREVIGKDIIAAIKLNRLDKE